jgi:glycosyltransferase involved in cell wall biosynthesis
MSYFLYLKLLENGIKSNILFHPNTLQNFENHLNLSSKETIKKNMGVDGKFVISILGGLRPGKGLEILNDAIERIEKSVLFNNYVVNICGTIQENYSEKYQRLKNICDKKNIKILLSNSSEYKMINKSSGSETVTEFEFLKSLFISDLGMLLYEGDQQDISSNNLPLYSFFHVPVVTLVGSYTAEVVKKFNVGYVIDNSIQLNNLLTKGFLCNVQSFGFREFNNYNQKKIKLF